MTALKFSIVIPLYNKEPYILRTLDSVRRQTCSNWECVVVDDGSADNGPAMVTALNDARIRVVRQANAGPSAARNRGAREATGDWLALLDADDYWLDYHLENLASLIIAYPHIGVVAGNFCHEAENGQRRPANSLPLGEVSTIQQYLKFNVAGKGSLVNSSSVAVNKELWHRLQGFRELFRLSEDADFWVRLCLHTDFAIHHQVSSVYFQDTSGASTRTCLYVGDAPFADLASSVPANYQRAFNEFLARSRMVSLALGTLLSGDKKLVRRMARASMSSSLKIQACTYMALCLLPLATLRMLYRAYRRRKGLPWPQFISVQR